MDEEAFASRAGYHGAIDRLLARTRGELLVFDTDLSDTLLGSRAAAERLDAMFAAERTARLRIVLHDTHWLETRAPRLRQLMIRHAHCVDLRQTPDALRHLTELFMIGDRRDLLVRFHTAHDRGKYLTDAAPQAEAWKLRFEAIWEQSVATAAPTRLGL